MHRSIQIELPVGSYVPEFYRDIPEEAMSARDFAEDMFLTRSTAENASAPLDFLEDALPEDADTSPDNSASVLPPSPSTGGLPTANRALALAAFAIIMIGLLGYGLRWWIVQRDSVHRFWQPMRSSAAPLILCPGAMVFSAKTKIAKAQSTDPYPYISVATADALSSLVDLLARDHINYSIQPTSSITLTDMREHPTVLLGAYNNEWSLRVLNGLRYRFSAEPNLTIYDSANPTVVWARPPQIAYNEADDFAIVARFHDSLTENFVIVLGGIGKNGTEAAAQFITSARYLDLLDRSQSKDWSSKNLEFVIRTKVIDGRAGPPTIEAVYVW